MMYTLYAVKAFGSVAVEAVLSELDLPHRIEDVQRNPDNSFPEWFKALNPVAQVPVLKLPDGSIMTESAAILIYLADLVPAAGLAPPIGSPVRPQYLRWMLFMATAVYMADLRVYYSDRYSADPAHAPAIRARATADLLREFGVLADALGQGPFLLGEDMSAADIYAAMLVTWAPDVAALYVAHPNLKRLHDLVASRPAIARVWARNGM